MRADTQARIQTWSTARWANWAAEYPCDGVTYSAFEWYQYFSQFSDDDWVEYWLEEHGGGADPSPPHV